MNNKVSAQENGFNELAGSITQWRIRQGFTECAEAAEAVRNADYKNFAEEIADCIIRLADIGNTIGMNIEGEINRKMAINRKRPRLHGKKTSL